MAKIIFETPHLLQVNIEDNNDCKAFDETDIEADQIKFGILNPFGVLELSKIEYKGVIYKGIRNSLI